MAAETLQTKEATRSAPARVIPTGTVSIPFIYKTTSTLDFYEAGDKDYLELCKVPAGCHIVEASIASDAAPDAATAKATILFEYKQGDETAINSAAANTIYRAGEVVVTDDSKEDAVVRIKLDVTDGTAASKWPTGTTISGVVAYTLQTSERFVTGVGQ
jgi:hypothetical protein